VKVLVLSKALVVGTYQRKLELIAQAPDVELVAVVPTYWREPGVGTIPLERAHTQGYRLLVHPIALNGRFHLFFWPFLGRLLRREQPDVLHVDEESFNLATFQALLLGKRVGARCLFFNWANLYRRLPPPFSWFERFNLAHAAYAVAGNRDAAAILRRKGYAGPLGVIPQFGVDAEVFTPLLSPLPPSLREAGRGGGKGGWGEVIGYAGRLVPQKGLGDLLAAVAGLPGVRLLIVGSGEQEPELHRRAEEADLRGRVEFAGRVPSADLPTFYRRMDVLVLPSRTTPNWKEQFGRVLIEAMACAVPVVGSDSGEIPHVIGEAGLVYPQRDVVALREQLERLRDPALRAELGRRGRERVLAHYTQERVAQAYLQVYRSIASAAGPAPSPGQRR
jgi:glycosyltransferase involved in cell wall biosynthesis